MQESETVFEGRLFRVVRKMLKTKEGNQRVREIIRHPGAVVILPLLGEHICLIENYRIAVDKKLFELPAGTREPNEPPLATAHRELAEETGYRADCIEPLTTFYASPGILDEQMHLFLATGLHEGPLALEEGEEIVPHLRTWPEVRQMILEGTIQDAKTLVGLLFFDAFHREKS